VLASAADAEARALRLVALHAHAAAAAEASGLDAKERGAADDCLAAAAGALLAAWRLEGRPPCLRRLLQVRRGALPACTLRSGRLHWRRRRSCVCACRAEACWGRCCPPGVSVPAPVLLCVRACAVPGAHPAVRALRPHDGARTRSGRARRRWLSWRRGRSHARSAPRSGWSPRRCTACWARPRRRRRPWPACT